MVLWSADTKDYSQPGTKKIIYAGISAGRPGAIVLMHDGGGNRAETVAALPRIITRLRQRGYHLVTVPQLIADDPPPPNQPPPHPLSAHL
jgi:chitin deacetylase